ncbi:hypothetical protein ABIB54_000541 [Frigoribacterium sp. UYMn621]
MSKLPAHKGWQDEATTDPTTISVWFREKNFNYGIRTGSVNNLYVVDLDGAEAQGWWKAQGFAEGAIVQTPSGPDRTHVYYRIDGETELPNTKKKLHPQIDTRGEGGLVCGPGSMLPTGTYLGNISNIPMIPAGLLAILPEKQTYVVDTSEHEPGDKVDVASPSELRQIASAIEALDELPKVWADGAGWRSEMYRVACWFSRMFQSPDYALTAEGALQIILEHCPTDAEWGVPEIMEQWASALQSTLGQLAAVPGPEYPHLPPIVEVIHFLPELTPGGQESFTTLVFNAPEGAPETWWKARRTLLIECLRAGRPIEEAASAAWHSVAGSPLRENEAAGLDELWKEAEKARATVAGETGAGAEALPDSERPSLALVPNRIELMTEAERAVGRKAWWGTEYMDWAETKVALLNRPYHRMNIWVILSAVFSDVGLVPDPAGPVGLNLFTLTLGKSTTGKSEASKLMKSVLKACFPKDDPVSIGGNASPNALLEALIVRDGKPSLFITDEAHGLFQQMQGDNSWMSGMKELLADLYEGEVPMILRSGKKNVSGIGATTHFITHLMGTVDGMTKALDEAMWVSGLLPRFIWAVGDELQPKPGTYRLRQVDGYAAANYDLMPKQWAAQFSAKKMAVRHGHAGASQIPVQHSNEAADRHSDMQEYVMSLASGHRQEELLKPALIRFGVNIRKCAILVALVDGKREVSLQHELTAIEAAEEWINNIFLMVGQTTSSPFSRSVDKVEKFIASNKGQEVRIERVYANSPEPKRFVDEFITQLVSEGRVTKTMTKDNSFLLSIKQNQIAVAA